MDEGHQFAKGILQCISSQRYLRQLKIALYLELNFLRAFILGYDVAARIGLHASLRRPCILMVHGAGLAPQPLHWPACNSWITNRQLNI